jgi:16S rRNA (uracil1498-N3)-methyltransferase
MITNFYVNPENVGKDSLKIVGEEAKHILSVLRYGSGDVIDVVDGCGTKYKVKIEEISRDFLEGKILSRTSKENEPDCHLTLAQAICRKERMDFLIEKATEIGVSSIIPIVTERSLIKVSGVSRKKNFDLCLIASLDKDSKSIKECEELKAGLKNILLIVGPEAGFTEEELSKAKAQGAIPMSLGSRRLRTETAGVVFLSLVFHQLGDLG